MSFTIERLPDEPIILFRVGEGYRITTDLDPAIAEIMQMLDALDERVYLVLDESLEPTPTMEELLIATQVLTRGENPLFHHPNIRVLLVITTDEVLRLSYQGAASEMFGQLHAEIFDTLDEALAYARAQG